jgi:hypothetical protein
LQGFDRSWEFCDAGNNYSKYTNVPSGEYTFKVMAANADGVWNVEGASLNIIISTPFWQEWWFILLISVLALLAVAVAIKYRTHKLIVNASILRAKVDEQTRELSEKTEQLESELNRRVEFTRAWHTI